MQRGGADGGHQGRKGRRRAALSKARDVGRGQRDRPIRVPPGAAAAKPPGVSHLAARWTACAALASVGFRRACLSRIGSWTATMLAATAGHAEIIRLLIDHGADIHAVVGRDGCAADGCLVGIEFVACSA